MDLLGVDNGSLSKSATTIASSSSSSKLTSQYHSIKIGSNTFTVDKRYINLEPQGDGSYGFVVSAYDIVHKRPVAIKKVRDTCTNVLDAKRILRELKLLRHFNYHENIIAIYDIMTDPSDTSDFQDIYIVTNLFESDLEKIISSRQLLTDHHFKFFIYQILRALKYVHSANVLHRDLKPSNILVNANCDVSICDFGLSRGFDVASDDPLTEYVVTRWYRAPELLCDSPYYGKAVDMWSVGCILAELINHQPMFRGQNPQHQLQCIVQKLGCPPKEKLDFIQSKSALSVIRKSAPKDPPHFSTLFPKDTSFLALDLLRKMLEFNPEDRVTVEEALEHPYLRDFHRVLPEPSCKDLFNFEFEIPTLSPRAKKDYSSPLSKRTHSDDSQTQCSDVTGFVQQSNKNTSGPTSVGYTNDLSILTPEQLQALIFDEVLLYRRPYTESSANVPMEMHAPTTLSRITEGVEDVTKYSGFSLAHPTYDLSYPFGSQGHSHQPMFPPQPNSGSVGNGAYMFGGNMTGTSNHNPQNQYMYSEPHPSQYMQPYTDQQVHQLPSLDMQTAMEVAALLGESTPPRDVSSRQNQLQPYGGPIFPPSSTYVPGSSSYNQQYRHEPGPWMMDPSQPSQYLNSQPSQYQMVGSHINSSSTAESDPYRTSASGNNGGGGAGGGADTTMNVTDDDLNTLLAMSFESGGPMDI